MPSASDPNTFSFEPSTSFPVDRDVPDVPRSRPRFQDRRGLHVVLFILTVVTTTLAGAGHYSSYLSYFAQREVLVSDAWLLVGGAWYSVTILAILGAHEMGHYLACRYYQVDASLPYFIPVLLPLTGTLGAVIRIREPIPAKHMLFDIGVAGPIAGFLVVVPTLFAGVAMSPVVELPQEFSGFSLGEPLLFRLASWLWWGAVPEGWSINLHPMAFAAWFGLLATALNLFPVGQLDGGHIAYAVLGRRSTWLTLGMIAVTVSLAFWSQSWIVWSALMVLMLFIFGPRHPRTMDEHVPLDRTRLLVAVAALIMLVLCFTPAPIEPYGLLEGR